MWGCSYTVIINNSKLSLVCINWKPSGMGNSSEIPAGSWILSESRSCLFLKQALASKCILNALWCGNFYEIPARHQTLSESASACLYVDRDIWHVLIVGLWNLGYFLSIFTDALSFFQGGSLLAILKMVISNWNKLMFCCNLG